MKKVWYVCTISLIAALGGLLFGFDTAVISGAEKTIQSLFKLNGFWHGFTISIALIGTLIGVLVAGRPADIFGRKKVLFAVAFFFGIAALGSALSHNWFTFLFFRFIGGLAVGASSVIAPTYIAEITPARIRGRLVASFQLNIVAGILLSYFSNYWISQLITVESWRWMLGIQVIPSAIFFCLIFIIPESPRWLVIKKNESKAKTLLKKFGSDDAEQELTDIKESLQSSQKVHGEKLFSYVYKMPILLAFLVAVFNQLSGINAVMYYAPRIFELVGYAKKSALLQSISIGLALFLFTIVGMLLIDRVGRKKLLLTGSLGMMFFLGMVAKTIFSTVNGSIWMLVYMIGFIAFFAFSQGTVIWVFISEIFPNTVRAKGQAFGSFTHWTMAVFISWLFPILAESSSKGGGIAFTIFAVTAAIQFIVVFMFFPETKGKSLEEIQKDFSPARHMNDKTINTSVT
jgi:sugar porter (SP) family MFS transporter